MKTRGYKGFEIKVKVLDTEYGIRYRAKVDELDEIAPFSNKRSEIEAVNQAVEFINTL